MFKPKVRFFIGAVIILILQFIFTYVSYVHTFLLSSNLIGTVIFCALHDFCLRMEYPTSLQYENKKKEKNFFLYILLEGFKLLPFFIIGYLALLAKVWLVGCCELLFYVISSQLHGIDISEHYPTPYYFALVWAFIMIVVFLIMISWVHQTTYISNLIKWVKNSLSSRESIKNALEFRSNVKQEKKNFSIYLWFLLIVGVVQKEPFLVAIMVGWSSYYTGGLAYLIINLFSAGLQLLLCLPFVNNSIKQNYGQNSLHLLNLNGLSGPFRTAGRFIVGLVVGDAGRTVGEQTANNMNDGINYAGDIINNKIVDARRTNHVKDLTNHGVPEATALLEAQKKFQYKNTPKSDVRILRGGFKWIFDNKGVPKDKDGGFKFWENKGKKEE